MKEAINGILGLIEILVLGGFVTWGAANGLEWLYTEVRKETIAALRRPQPSLEQFTQKLTAQPQKTARENKR